MKDELKLAVNAQSPAVAVEIPSLQARASAEFSDEGFATVKLQDKSGRIVMQVHFEPTAAVATQAKPARAALKRTGKPGRKPLSSRDRKARALKDLQGRIARKSKVPTTQKLARAWKVPTSTAATWMRNWERQGEVPRRKRVGRRMMFVPRPLNGRANGHAEPASTALN